MCHRTFLRLSDRSAGTVGYAERLTREPSHTRSAVLRRVCVAGLVVTARIAHAQASGTAASVDATVRRAVIDSITVQLERLYVDTDTGRMIASGLRTRLASGVYDTIADPTRFAARLTADLRAVNGDLHLGVVYRPGGGFSPFSQAMATAERQRHFGLGRLDVLPGNVGYMELNGFAMTPDADAILVAALRYLETTDAIIIDVRRNNGGSPAFANLLLSHFTTADTIATVVSRVRGLQPGSVRTATQYTLATVPGPRRPDVPLYVLSSRNSVSAAEWFTFTLQNLKRATVVGERTAGAGHNVTFVPSGHGFSTTISYSRVMDARTGKEWEKVGVQPDVAVDPATALDVAHSAALGVLSANAPSDARRRELDRIRQSVDSRMRSTRP